MSRARAFASLPFVSSLLLAFVALVMSASPAQAKPCPNVLLVLDQSLSMQADPNGNPPDDPAFAGKSKWQLLQDTVSAVVKQYGENVPFGLELFTGPGLQRGNWDPSSIDNSTCQQGISVNVAVSHSSTGQILQKLHAAMPSSETPTNGAIHVARTDPSLTSGQKEKYIILVTDGDPNCGIDGYYLLMSGAGGTTLPSDPSAAPGGVLDELNQAYKAGIKTFVVGFDALNDMNASSLGQGVNPANLDLMAYWGFGGYDPTDTSSSPKKAMCNDSHHCYFSAGVNQMAFLATFDAIVSQIGGEFSMICDDSCYSLGCPMNQKCVTTETNPDPHCEVDMCQGAKCSGNQFCRDGGCVTACPTPCSKTNEICVNGTCQPDLCATKKCSTTQVCDPSSGTCIDFPCGNCRNGEYCDIPTATCLTDLCQGNQLQCPSGGKCVNHRNCELGGGGGGCTVGAPVTREGFDPSSAIAGTALLASLAMLLRRRSRPAVVSAPR